MAADYASALRWMQSLGYSQADLDDFIRRNGAKDIGRIESAFSTYNDRALSTGTVAAATQAVLGVSDYNLIDHTGMVAIPTPLASEAGEITTTAASDGIISGAGPRLAYSSTTGAGSAALTVNPSAPAAALATLPVWVWAAAAVAVFLILSKD